MLHAAFCAHRFASVDKTIIIAIETVHESIVNLAMQKKRHRFDDREQEKKKILNIHLILIEWSNATSDQNKDLSFSMHGRPK